MTPANEIRVVLDCSPGRPVLNGRVQRVFDCHDPTQQPLHTDTCVRKLKRGRVAVIPDESMYLMVADAFSLTGVTRIRHLKSQENEPLTVLVGHQHTVDGVAGHVPVWARDLMQAFWPGPLTLILRQQPSLAWPLTAPGIGLRMPLHPVALAVVRGLGPTACTSVNRLGMAPARDCDDAYEQFDRDVDVYLDAGSSPFEHRSTMLDATGDHPVVLRSGGITAEQIEQVVPGLEVRPA